MSYIQSLVFSSTFSVKSALIAFALIILQTLSTTLRIVGTKGILLPRQGTQN